MRVAVVVAKFREDVSWAAAFPPEWDVFVYDKSDGSLPNVGREAETFARFIAEKYDVLAGWDYAMFLQGAPFDHVAKSDLPSQDDDVADLVADHVGLGGLGLCFVSDCQGKPHHEGLPIRKAHELVFGSGSVPAQWQFCAGAQYLVPTSYILGRDRSFWDRLHDLLATEQVCAWSMERLWPCAFRPEGQWDWPVRAYKRPEQL